MVGGKKGNRTEPPDYTGQSLRKLPIVAVPGFTAITELNYFGVVSKYYLNLITRVSRFYLFKYNLLYMDS